MNTTERNRRFSHFLSFVVIASLLSGCEDSVKAIPEGSPLTAMDIVKSYKAGNRMCGAYDQETNSCRLVAELAELKPLGLSLIYLDGNGTNRKVTYELEYLIKGEMLCSRMDVASFTRTLDVYRSNNNLAELTPTDRSYRKSSSNRDKETLSKLIEVQAEQQIDGQEACYRFYESNSPSNGLDREIIWVEFVDGEQTQVDFSIDRQAFFDKSENLLFRVD